MSSKGFYIAMDTHVSFTELAVVDKSGRVLKRDRCHTRIPELVALLEQLGQPRFLTFEEGPLADWLARELNPYVDELTVCEPRRNRLIAKDGDKDDAIDAEKLAQLLRGGYLRKVHQSESLEQSLIKQHVGFYHDRVRERVRQGHQIVSYLRRHGVFASISRVADSDERRFLWSKLPRRKLLRSNLDRMWREYEMQCDHEGEVRCELIDLARRITPVRRFTKVPGFAWIRSITFYAYIDTPWRFASKSALWKYCGIGLTRHRSGNGPMKTRLDYRGHRRLKDVLLGAARSAVEQGADNPYADKYQYWIQEEGMYPSTARRNVARCLAVTLWSMWKTGNKYDPAQVRGVGLPVTRPS